MGQKHRVLIWKPRIQKRESNQESKKAGKREEHENRLISSFPAFLIHLQSADSNGSIFFQRG
jgi:hypothetical protein